MTHFKRGAGLLLALALVLGLQTAAFAQTGAASITGLVTDQSGAATPGVTVTATNQATNVDYTAVSNSAGNFTITNVPIGSYVVKAALTGFKTTTWKGISLEAKQIARLDFKLEVGALEDSIEVVGQSPVLQTESATVGEVLSGRTVESLPLNGRNTSQLALLLPGSVTPNPGAQTAIRGAGARPYVNGNREQTNNFMVDGVEINDTMDNRVGYQPSPDAIAEISVETNNYAADTGNVAGGVISNVIKSGANSFRGNLFEFYRNSDFDANTWENNRSKRGPPGAQAAHLRRHAGRPDHQGQAVLLRQLPGVDPGPARHADRLGGPGGLAPRRPVEHHHPDQGPAHRPALPGQPDPAQPHQPDGARDPEQPRLPAPQPQRHRSHGQLRGRVPQHHARPPGRPAARLERLDQATSCSCASRSPSSRSRPTSRPSRCCSPRAASPPSATWRSTGATCSARR